MSRHVTRHVTFAKGSDLGSDYATARRNRLDLRVNLGLREWLFIVGGGLLLTMVATSFVCRRMGKSRRSDEAAVAFLRACSEGQDEGACKSLLNANHEDCFFVNDVPGGRFSRGHFRDHEYNRCVSMGFKAWQEDRWAKRKAAEQERKRLGLPP